MRTGFQSPGRSPHWRACAVALVVAAVLSSSAAPARADCGGLGRFFSTRPAAAAGSAEPSFCWTDLTKLLPDHWAKPSRREEFRLDISPSLQASLADGTSAKSPSFDLATAAVTGGALLAVPIVGALSWWRYEDEPFHVSHEGWFGADTYAGGADKASHFFVSYLGSQVLTSTYERLGHAPRDARLYALGVAAVGGVLIEVGDGGAHYGFSWEDVAMDVAGALTGIGIDAAGAGDLVGFRYGYVGAPLPPGADTTTPPRSTDYSREIYTADLKIAGLARRMNWRAGPARFLLFSMTYGSKGYRYSAAEYRQRQVGLELGINFPEVLSAAGVPEQKWWGRTLYFLFNFFRVPFTAIGIRYDLNHREWHGPNAGNVYDPGP
jgi:uncharacterized protein YfiM (DUF2279 family)